MRNSSLPAPMSNDSERLRTPRTRRIFDVNLAARLHTEAKSGRDPLIQKSCRDLLEGARAAIAGLSIIDQMDEGERRAKDRDSTMSLERYTSAVVIPLPVIPKAASIPAGAEEIEAYPREEVKTGFQPVVHNGLPKEDNDTGVDWIEASAERDEEATQGFDAQPEAEEDEWDKLDRLMRMRALWDNVFASADDYPSDDDLDAIAGINERDEDLDL